ncbi:MAG TPA: division/cell wall cluster transcriptional repressor MraZ [Candidatus Eisenbacteria bacterium]|jgi:MraZ protein
MASFLGTYRHSIDHKGRVSIPSRFRRALSGDAEETFIILRGLESCVSLYPLDEWRGMEERLRSRTFYEATNRRFQRTMLQHASHGALDAQGRVAIPPALLGYASLKKEAVVNGVLDHIEIWDPQLFERYLEGSDRSFEDMAGELLL